MKSRFLIACTVAAAAIIPCFCGGLVVAGEPVRVATIARDSLKSTNRTLHGARKVIKRENPGVEFHHFLLSDDDGANAAILDSINALRPNLALTVGSIATEFAQKNLGSIPIVFSAVKYPALSGFVSSMAKPGKNITGASLNIPVDIQFRYFKEIVPGLKKVGVLYTENTASLIPQARIVAQSAGLQLVAMPVNNFKELPRALDSLASTVDGLWSVADPNLFDPRSTKYILLNTMRKGLPLMGFSRHVVESGALFALDFDYKAIGLQAGSIANRVVRGERPASISVTMADVIWFHYNAKTAQHINVVVPDELVAIAKEVYR